MWKRHSTFDFVLFDLESWDILTIGTLLSSDTQPGQIMRLKVDRPFQVIHNVVIFLLVLKDSLGGGLEYVYLHQTVKKSALFWKLFITFHDRKQPTVHNLSGNWGFSFESFIRQTITKSRKSRVTGGPRSCWWKTQTVNYHFSVQELLTPNPWSEEQRDVREKSSTLFRRHVGMSWDQEGFRKDSSICFSKNKSCR